MTDNDLRTRLLASNDIRNSDGVVIGKLGGKGQYRNPDGPEAVAALDERDARIKALEAEIERAIETLAASKHLIGKYTPDHHWLPEHDQRIASLRNLLTNPTPAKE